MLLRLLQHRAVDVFRQARQSVMLPLPVEHSALALHAGVQLCVCEREMRGMHGVPHGTVPPGAARQGVLLCVTVPPGAARQGMLLCVWRSGRSVCEQTESGRMVAS